MGIHLQQERIKFVAAKIDGQPSLGRFYLTGPYAMTIGKPLHFNGRPNDWALVRSVADEIMRHIGQLSLASANRINNSRNDILDSALAPEQISLPTTS